MKSSTGAYYIALDHVRALAIVMICAWHFMHASHGYPIPFSYVPAIFPFSLFSEGHTGVALFMTLSGYLFAKLLEGKKISYRHLMWNRALRILPLLSLVVLVVGAMKVSQGVSISHYCASIAKGVVLPFLPNGGWAVTVEFHYYLILPLLLWMLAKSPLWPLALVVAAISLRLLIYHERGEIQSLAYFTIIGRIDQFVLGMLLCQCRSYFSRRHSLALVTIVVFMLIFWGFDFFGGFAASLDHSYLSAFWIILPTIEGLAYGVAIAWYDTSFSPSNAGVSKFIGRLGQYSYSIFLLHFFVVFQAARFVNEHIMDISNFYLALMWSFVFVAVMMVPGYLSFRFIESPFLKLRKNYIRESGVPNGALPNKVHTVA
jgi:peptidoglycan/LPS O-acetylase OafA/YrhL